MSISLTKNINLLYVEDDRYIREETSKLLTYICDNVITAKDGKEGLEKFISNNIDLVVTDLTMPNMSGLEMLEEINKIKKTNSIIISAHKEPNQLLKSIKLGVNDYLVKPLDIMDLKNSIINLVEKDMSSRKEILKDYERVLENNTILTKLNKNGKIIYGNKKFYEKTGYSEDEILNKSYDFIHHKKLNNIKKMLKRVTKNTKQWQGRCKNRKKDNSTFWTRSSISPIFNEKGKIIEYIALHNDITINKELKEKVTKTKWHLDDAIKLSNQYEMAINETSILSKTDLKGRITFVNEKFCNISGYKKEELLGKHHNIIRHEDMNKNLFSDIWETIKSGDSWKGIIKNKSKDGSPYWVLTTIIPIKDKTNKTTEYMAIRHDVTEVFQLHREIEETQRELIYKLGEVAERRSKETGNHVKRVAEYSKQLALLYGLAYKESQILFDASPMHDIGKIAIPDEILMKPSKLTSEDFEIMKTHAQIGHNILNGSKRPVLNAAATIAKEHHEKYDGTGYPDGLKGEEIHIYGRITAIADVFDALGSDRYYKKAWSDVEIFDLLEREKGKHFDPKLVDLFMENLDIFLEIRSEFSD